MMKEAKKVINFEEAVKKGLDIKSIKYLFVSNIFAILITIILTFVMRQLILANSNTTIKTIQYYNRFSKLFFHSQVFYQTLLMRIAYNGGKISSDRYVLLNLTSTEFIKKFHLENYEHFSNAQFSSIWEELLKDSRDYYEKEENSVDYFDYFFDSQSTTKNGLERVGDRDSGFSISNSLYNTVLDMTNSVIFNIQQLSDKNAIDLDMQESNMFYIVNNMMQSYSPAMSELSKVLSALIRHKLKHSRLSIVALFFTSVGLMTIAMSVSITLIAKILKTFRLIFSCLEDMKLNHIEHRIVQLSYVGDLMDKEKLKPSHLKILSGKDQQDGLLDRKPKREIPNSPIRPDLLNQSRPSRQWSTRNKTGRQSTRSLYFFTLLSSIIIMGLFYIGQFTFSGIIAGNFVSKVNSVSELFEKEEQIMDIEILVTTYRSSILHTILIGREAQVFEAYIEEYAHRENSLSSDLASRLNALSNTQKMIDEEIQGLKIKTRFSSLLNSDICKLVPAFAGVETVCGELDVSIPQKGMVQAYYKVKSIFDAQVRMLRENQTSELAQSMASQDYTSFELTYKLIYHETGMYMLQMFFSYINDYMVSSVQNAKTLITITMICLILLSCTFIVLTFRDIFRVKEEIAFSFKISSLNGIIDNQRIRVVFLKLFKLDNQYFS